MTFIKNVCQWDMKKNLLDKIKSLPPRTTK